MFQIHHFCCQLEGLRHDHQSQLFPTSKTRETTTVLQVISFEMVSLSSKQFKIRANARKFTRKPKELWRECLPTLHGRECLCYSSSYKERNVCAFLYTGKNTAVLKAELSNFPIFFLQEVFFLPHLLFHQIPIQRHHKQLQLGQTFLLIRKEVNSKLS